MDTPDFQEIWRRLEEIIGSGITVRTLARGVPNYLQWLNEGIAVTTKRGREVLPREWFEDVWMTLLAAKILPLDQFPGTARYRGTAISSILALLPYVDFTVHPRTALFLVDHLFSHGELSDTFGVGLLGGIRFRGNADDPQLVVFITGAALGNTDEHQASHPYRDRWEKGILYYTGEGLTGDQTMTKGNLALSSSIKRGNPVYGFQKQAANQYRYLGRFRVEGVDEEQQPDQNGNLRRVYVFSLRPQAPNEKVELLRYLGSIDDEGPLEDGAAPPTAPAATEKTDTRVFDIAGAFPDLLEAIRTRGFHYEPWQVAAYVTALRTKPFVILAGVSGTGKSKLPALVAEATGGEARLLPVRPDWTDSSDVLGYTDLQGRFRPGPLLALAREAAANPERYYVCIVDEMNLARVEQYFAEVLSRLEDRHPVPSGGFASGLLLNQRLGDSDAEWAQLGLPRNLAIVGTINMDETTHGFSRKVLDRAFTLELSDVDLSAWQRETPSPRPRIAWPVEAWYPRAIRLGGLPDVEDVRGIVQQVIATLTDVNVFLRHAQLQVGYRTRDEIALFVIHARDLSAYFVTVAGERVDPLDLALQMKILPRLVGGSNAVRRALLQLLGWAFDGKPRRDEEEADSVLSAWHASGRTGMIPNARYPVTAARLALMWERLLDEGFTSFWL